MERGARNVWSGRPFRIRFAQCSSLSIRPFRMRIYYKVKQKKSILNSSFLLRLLILFFEIVQWIGIGIECNPREMSNRECVCISFCNDRINGTSSWHWNKIICQFILDFQYVVQSFLLINLLILIGVNAHALPMAHTFSNANNRNKTFTARFFIFSTEKNIFGIYFTSESHIADPLNQLANQTIATILLWLWVTFDYGSRVCLESREHSKIDRKFMLKFLFLILSIKNVR